MATRVFPSEGSRLAYTITSSRFAAATGNIVNLWADAAATIPASCAMLDGTPVTNLTIDAYSRLPLFLGPDGVDTVWVTFAGGPSTPVYAREDDRLDILEAASVNVRTHGAVGDGRRLRNVTATTGSTTVTCSGAGFTSADLGKLALVYSDTAAGTVTTIAAVNSATSITLTAAAGITGSGTGSWMIYGTDDAAAINRAMVYAASLAPSTDTTAGVNEPQGGGQVVVTAPAVGGGFYCIGSQVIGRAGTALHCDGMVANLQTDRYNPGVLLQPYSTCRRLYYEALFGCGVQAGTSTSGQADIHIGTLVTWHVGKLTEVGGAGRSTDALALLGYGFLIDLFWTKGGQRGILGTQGSDLFINRAFIIGAHTGASFTTANQVRGNIILDSCGENGGGYSGVVLDNACSDVNLNVQAFEVAGVTRTLDAVVETGKTSTNLNVDIVLNIQAQRTGGVGLKTAYTQDAMATVLTSNTAAGATGGNNMTYAVTYGTGNAGSMRISCQGNGSLTGIYSGTLYGDLDATQSGAGNNVRRFLGDLSVSGRSYIGTAATAPTDANIGTSQISMYLDEAGNNLKIRVRYSNGTTLKTATVALI